MTSTALTPAPSWTPTVSLPAAFEVHNPDFLNLTGHHPTLSILTTNHNTSTAFAHEAPVYISQTRTLYMTSNILTDPTTNSSTIQISTIALDDPPPLTAQLITPTPAIPNPNGGTAINETAILLCGQGDATHPAGLYTLSLANDSYTSSPLLTTFYARAYNSPNDVAIHPADGSVWFTDPDYASIQGLRGSNQPQLPNQVYRYNPTTHAVRVVADGFDKPNGIHFAPGGRTVYVTDTGAALGNGTVDRTRAATIYAFDVTTIHGEPFLTNRRVFAMADDGVPDGIKVDQRGNVYAGCGDGVNVWSAGGVLLGKIRVEGGVANLVFGEAGEMFLMGETRVWVVRLDGGVKGA
ncbi:calcium-dependent phosphotriesterase [Aspergillus violaceofuscus CBS 115571]|uniref:Calcium-dependent phosphotriesterase n=1 Tax=Aspergillus violaceofuscus (strain CBS 115571) TaxID=1450538 RepID=A0A2V5H0F4_ASPV1|nr:calcium-dependent phosphotriesterase [Aspergillus violaceofuscus CBS 115571]